MKFIWDKTKNITNIEKHKISFEEAKTVFLDPLHISLFDERFDYFEERWITIGTTSKHQIVVVAHLHLDEKGEEIIRIISARKANPKEVKQYETV